MSDFQEIILPSVGLPYKPTYNLTETCKILDCHYSTLAEYVDRGEITIRLPNKRVYAKDLERLFSKKHKMKTKNNKKKK